MNNWRLLLLAVVVVVQPIGSFTESNLIDGRECCERSEDARIYGYRKTEERRLLDGNREDRPTNTEQHRLRSLDGIREERRYETIRGPMRPRIHIYSDFSERTERRTGLSKPTEHRLVREQERRHRETSARTREAYEARNRDESRYILDENERNFRESRYRDTLDAARSVRLSREAKNTRLVERESRNTMFRLPIRNSRSNDERRISANRETIIKPEQKDITHSDSRRDLRLSASDRSNSRIQLDDNRERRVFDRRTQEGGTELDRSHFSGARINEIRVVRTQRSVGNKRDSREVKVEFRKQQQDTELRDRVSAVRRDSERISTDRTQRDGSRRSMDSLRNTAEQRLDSRQTRSSRNLDVTRRNMDRMERRSVSMDRLSRLRESRDEREAKARDVRNESSGEQRQERENNHISRDRGADSRQESRRTTSRMDTRESLEERRQQREASRLSRGKSISELREAQSTERTQEPYRNIRESSEERSLQRENSRLSRNRIISLRESRKDARESSELRQKRDNNHFSNNRVFIHRENHDVEDTEQARSIIHSSRTEINFRKLDSTNRRDVRGNERSDLRRLVLERSMERARITHSTSAERSNDVRETSRAFRSVEAAMIREDTRNNERDRYDQGKSIEQRVTRNITPPELLDIQRSRIESKVDRVVQNRNGVRGSGDQDRSHKLDARRTSRAGSTRLERLVRVRAEIRENERRETQREERNDDRTRNLLTRRSSERMFAQRRLQSRESSKDAQMRRNRGEVRERLLSKSRQDNGDATRNSRNVRGEVRGENIVARRSEDNRDSQNVREIRMDDRSDSRLSRDSTKDSRERFLQRESRDVTDRLSEESRMPITGIRNERVTRNNERQAMFARSLRTVDARREFKSDIRAYNDLAMERINRKEPRFTNDEREEAQFRNRDDVTTPDKLVPDETNISNWQMVFYTLQGVYLCGLLVQMMTENANKTKKRTFNWWSSPNNLIKVD